MRFDPILPLVRYKIGDGSAIAANDDTFVGGLHSRQQFREVRLRLMHVNGFHGLMLVPLVHLFNFFVRVAVKRGGRPAGLQLRAPRRTIPPRFNRSRV